MRLPFYATISIAYLVVGTLWTLLCCLHSSEVTFVQKFVSAVMFLGLMHSTMQYMDCKIWNDSNGRKFLFVVLACGCWERDHHAGILATYLSLLGYGVVRPSLGMMKYKVLVFSVLFFICNTIKDVFKQASVKSSVEDTSFDNNSSSNSTSAVFILFPAAIMNSIAMLWTYNALTSTIENLMEKRAKHKIEALFALSFRDDHVVLLGRSVCCILFVYGRFWHFRVELHGCLDDGLGPRSIIFLCFACISVLWRPAKNSSRYANYTQANTGITNEDFSTEALTDDEDDFGDEEYDEV